MIPLYYTHTTGDDIHDWLADRLDAPSKGIISHWDFLHTWSGTHPIDHRIYFGRLLTEMGAAIPQPAPRDHFL
jgi:hypothetical protein